MTAPTRPAPPADPRTERGRGPHGGRIEAFVIEPDKPLRAVGYVRVSTKRQAEQGRGRERQREAIRTSRGHYDVAITWTELGESLISVAELAGAA